MASGTPVIAYGKGGAKETVRDIRENPTNGTGILYQAQTKEALSEAVNLFCEWEKKIQSENCFLQASRFSRQVFAQEFLGMLESCYQGKEEEEKKNFSSL
jgi:glycogen synthase